MKKMFQALACLSVLICAAYGAYVLVNKYILTHKYKESTEFDDLYEAYISGKN